MSELPAPLLLTRQRRGTCARWHILAIFTVLSTLNGTFWLTFAPIEPIASTYFGVSTTWVNALSAIFMLLYAPGSILSTYATHTTSLRGTMLMAAALMAASGWLRAASAYAGAGAGAFALLFVGQSLAALAQPAFTNSPAKLASEWFGENQRDLATAVASLAQAVGNAVGQIVPALLVACDASAGGACATRDAVHGMPTLLLAEAIAATVAGAWAVACFKAEPPKPPSGSALLRRQSRSSVASAGVARPAWWRTLLSETRALLTDRHYVVLLVAFTFGLSITNALLTCLAQLIQPLYCSDSSGCDLNAIASDSALYGGAFLGGGLFGAAVVSILLDRYHAYRSVAKAIAVGGALSLACTFLLQQILGTRTTAATAASWAVAGAFLVPLLPVSLQCAVECTFPISEEASASLLILAGNLGGLGFTFVCQELVRQELAHLPPKGAAPPLMPKAQAFVLAAIGAAVLAFLSFHGPYKRLDHDRDAVAVAPAEASRD